jgi:hypothetical protein
MAPILTFILTLTITLDKSDGLKLIETLEEKEMHELCRLLHESDRRKPRASAEDVQERSEI